MTSRKETSHRLRHGQALTLQYAAQILMNVHREPEIIPRVLSPDQLNAERSAETTALGCGYAARILLPFLVELALKALIGKANNGPVERTHRLCRLHDALPAVLQDNLDLDFEKLKLSETPEETRSLRQILLDHDNDFPDWRYLDGPEGLATAPILTLQYVACSVLNVYNSTSAPPVADP